MAEQQTLIGKQVGHYRLLSLLGQGGFAEVYLGEHIHLRTLVAVKMLHARLTGQDQQAFLQEAQMVAALQHPHIVRVFDFGFEQDFPYLVMDYASAGTVRQAYPKGRSVPLQVVVQWTRQVAEALQVAHDQRVIHRDIKPENMLLGRQQEILLSDFGIALALQTSHTNSTQNIAGTVAYMAPEQIQAHPIPASDQYSLGVVVYEWLCGARPFQGSYTEIAIKHATVPPPLLRAALPALAPEVEQVIMTALHKDPRQRFPSVRAFAQALDYAFQRSVGSNALPASPLQTLTAPTAHPVHYAYADPSAASTTGFPGVPPLSTAAFTPATSQSTPAGNHPYAPAPYASFLTPTTTGLGPHSAHSAAPVDQSQIVTRHTAPRSTTARPRGVSRRALLVGGVLGGALVGATAIGGFEVWQALYRSLLSGQSTTSGTQNPLSPLPGSNQATPTRTLTGPQGILLHLGISPNGQYMAAGSMDGTAYIWSAEKDAPSLKVVSTITPAQSDNYPWSLAWSANNHLVINFAHGNVQVIEPSQGRHLLNVTSNDFIVAQTAWSPDERYLAISTSNNTVRVYSYPDMHMLSEYTDHTDTITALAWSPDGKYLASGSDDTKVKIWEPLNPVTRFVFNDHTDTILSLGWSPDSTRVASAASANSDSANQYDAYIWTATTGNILGKYKRTGGAPMGRVRWARKHDQLAAYNGDAAIDILDGQTAKTQHTITTGVIYDMDWTLDDSQIATAGYNKQVDYWQLPS